MNKTLFNPLPQEERYFRILEVFDNYFTGQLLDEYTTQVDGVIQHNFKDTETTVIIIKTRGGRAQDSLCRVDWDTKTFDDKLYTWIDNNSRDASGVTEYVNPPYTQKDENGDDLTVIIKAQFNPYGTGFVSDDEGLVYWEEIGNRTWLVPSKSFTLFEIIKYTDTTIKINGYSPSAGRYSHNWCSFGLYNVELVDGVNISVLTSGVIYLEATTAGGLNDWVVTPKWAAESPDNTSSANIHYLAYVTVTDGKITLIEQPPTGVIKFPPYLESYATDKKMVLIVDEGIYKWIEIGDCNA